MASEQFPMFKLATLLARQMSSPIATRVKTYAKSHPRFGTEVCVRVAEAWSACEWAARVWALRLAGTALRPRRPPLPRTQAVELGADLIGEIVIFTLGSMIIIYEVNRQAAIKEGKALHIKSEWLAVKLSLEELQTELALQQQEIDGLHRTLLRLTSPEPSPPTDPSPAPPTTSDLPPDTPRLPPPSPSAHQPSPVQPVRPSSHTHDIPPSSHNSLPAQAPSTLKAADRPPPLKTITPPTFSSASPALPVRVISTHRRQLSEREK